MMLRIPGSIALGLLVLTLCACRAESSPRSAQTTDDRRAQEYDRLLAATAEQQAIAAEQIKKAEEQQKRMEALVSRWEKQADRYDAVLTRWENEPRAGGR